MKKDSAVPLGAVETKDSSDTSVHTSPQIHCVNAVACSLIFGLLICEKGHKISDKQEIQGHKKSPLQINAKDSFFCFVITSCSSC